MNIDYLNKESDFKAVGVMIFCGSATVGAMRAGYHVDKILEISDDIVKQNAYHFTKNSSIPVVLPSEWENKEYLQDVKNSGLDLIYANCPCSSLSSINRNASVDGKNNVHFYRVFNVIKETQPKAFIIENAPTLIKLGYPIIQDVTHELGDLYRFTILRDCAGHHNVAMKRTRTMIVGWRRDVFDGIPLLHADRQNPCSVKDTIGHLYNVPLNEENNHVCIEGREWAQYEHLYKYVSEGETSLRAFIRNWDELKPQFEEKDQKYIERIIERLKIKPGIWDKTPLKARENGTAPSLTSVTKIIHPVNARQFTIREYAELMNYPMEFKFYPDECETPITQCIAQGVPANFMQWITAEIKEALSGNREIVEDTSDKIVNFQHHIKMKYQPYTQQEIDEITFLDVQKKSPDLLK